MSARHTTEDSAAPFQSPNREPELDGGVGAGAAVARLAIDSSAARGLKVLLVDDSPLVTKMLATVLRCGGYEVVTAADGIEAAQAVYREMPDVVLLDIFMPRMNGYQVCRLIKQDVHLSHIPVLINTASESRSAEFWSRHTGADGFVMKGVPAAELLAAIEEVTRGRSGAAPAGGPLEPPGPEEILTKVCALVDEELYGATLKGMEWQAMLENLTEGILTVDNAGRIGSANHYLCGLLGVHENDLKNRECAEAIGGPLAETLRPVIREALSSGRAAARESEATALAGARAGQRTPVEIGAVAVRDYLDEIVGAVCVFRDITRQREIQSLNRLKNDLTDMIVHDLRTPLTSLLTGLQVLPEFGEINEDQRAVLDISVEGGETLLRMINDLLDISKMEDGSMKIERRPVEPAELMQRAVRQVDSLAGAKGLRLECEDDAAAPPLHVDEDKLTRTLVNLLSNSIRHTPANGCISLAVRFVSREGRRDSVIFACSDTGEGIPEAAFERIFEKFGQVQDGRGAPKMSTGLGLTFCKMSVEAHGGRIWVQSAVGQGSTFSFAIPADDESARCAEGVASFS